MCPQLRQLDLSGCLGVTNRMLGILQQALTRQVEEDINYGTEKEPFFLAIGGIICMCPQIALFKFEDYLLNLAYHGNSSMPSEDALSGWVQNISACNVMRLEVHIK